MFVLPIVGICTGYTSKTLSNVEFEKGFIVSDSGSTIVNASRNKWYSTAYSDKYINIIANNGHIKLETLDSLLLLPTGVFYFGNSDVLIHAELTGDRRSVDLVFIFYNKMIHFTVHKFKVCYIFLIEGYNGYLYPCIMYEGTVLRYGDNCTDELYSFRTVSDDKEKNRILRGMM